MSDLRLKEVLHDTYIKASNAVSKPSDLSTFETAGKLTAQEYLSAGELLVHKCGSWRWCEGNPKKSLKYLPPDKQYLMTRVVTCNSNIKDVSSEVVEDDWVALRSKEALEDETELPSDPTDQFLFQDWKKDKEDNLDVENDEDDEDQDQEDIPDADTFNVKDNLLQSMSDDDLVISDDHLNENGKNRMYDVCICYNPHYQVPHVWLFGYDYNGKPLTPEQMYEDISEDHRGQTVTVKPHPHVDIPFASIHPCNHAKVMKKIVENTKRSGKEIRPDLYLFIFLKFLSAVIPNIEYDHTFDMDIELYPRG